MESMNETDRSFYEKRLMNHLPQKLMDIHAHVWLDLFVTNTENTDSADTPRRTAAWPIRVASENTAEDLAGTYEMMFPGKQVTPMIFGYPDRKYDMALSNEYIMRCSQKYGCPSLLLADPEWSGAYFEQQVSAGGFYGCKPYLNYAPDYIPENEIRIFDFLPRHHLEVLDSRGWMAMLHIPRSGRLKDPVNIAQMLEIDRKYPHAKIIIAHAGRAYCPEDMGNAFEMLSKTENLFFDISANTNRTVFRHLIEAAGPKRILFGSDLPVLRMRSRRICENGNYVNLVPKGIYGDVSRDRHMREVEGDEAGKLTFLLYEEIHSFLQAAEDAGLTVCDLEDVFYGNASRLVEGLKTGRIP